MKSRVVFSKQSDEWSTPQQLFAELHEEFNFGLDAAATAQNRLVERYLGPGSVIAEDALSLDWWPFVAPGKAVWLNPPYSRVREFVAKAAAQARAYEPTMVVCLLPVRTDTRWWHDHVWDRELHKPRPGVEVRFLKGRLKFGGAKAGAPFPSVVVVFRPVEV